MAAECRRTERGSSFPNNKQYENAKFYIKTDAMRMGLKAIDREYISNDFRILITIHRIKHEIEQRIDRRRRLDVVFSILEIETARTAPTHKRTYEHKPKNKKTWPADKRNWIENFQFWCNDLRQMTSIDCGTWTRMTRLLRSITSSFITFHHFFCRYLAILSVPRISKRYSVATSEAK